MRWCVWMLQRGHSGGWGVVWRSLCVSLRKGDLSVLSWARGATSDAVKYLFRAAYGWWRCAQYFVIVSCG